MKTKKMIDNISDEEDAFLSELLVQGTTEQSELISERLAFAVRLEEAIKAKGWTHREFAQAIRQHPSVVSRWLSGRHNPTFDSLVAIQRVLGIRLLNLEVEKQEPVASTMHLKSKALVKVLGNGLSNSFYGKSGSDIPSSHAANVLIFRGVVKSTNIGS